MDRIPLRRPSEDRVLAGVCSGLAAHLGLRVGVVRGGAVLLALCGGAGALFYAWLWATVPQEVDGEGLVPLRRTLTTARPAASGSTPSGEAPETPEARHDRSDGARARFGASARRLPIAEILLGVGLLAVGVALVLMQFDVHVRLELILPAFAVCIGVGLAWWQFADRAHPDRNQVPRVLGAIALVAVGVLMFFVTARQPNAWTVIAAALAVLLGVALAIAPWALRLNRELIAERAGRARESARAEIAAHLHDSVLQTLALIQQRSAPGSDVARLARGQERELRDWLFSAGDGEPAEQGQSIERELRAHAEALEERYTVRFEVVTVGGGAGGAAAPESLVAAAREAMLNAAHHAGGAVSVYIEFTPDRASVDVTDRGPGFEPDALPDGRMGVRDSILGRMERAGGSARIVPGPGGSGTSVRLSAPRADRDRGDEHEETETP